jgi:exopolyphosphatase/guanosine-5'-triphosphate,3'-diphosphate pyrophosphatase
LLSGETLRRAITKKFEIWARFQEPDPAHVERVVDGSLGIYDALVSCGVTRRLSMQQVDIRDLLNIAAIVHHVGHANGKKHHKRALHRLQELDVPPGWTAEHLRTIGLAARYHRGALPIARRSYARLARSKRRIVALLGGILRLAEAIENAGRQPTGKMLLERRNGYLVLHADGTPSSGKDLERIAARRYLLETALGFPILVCKTG